MSSRKIAKIIGISPTYLSLLLNGKRLWRGNLKERYEEIVNTFVTTPPKPLHDWPKLPRMIPYPVRGDDGAGGLEPPTSSMP